MTTPKLKPFFTFYGGKWRAAPRYPKPKHNIIIEPFAGSAGYSMRYPDRTILLIDKDIVIAQTWEYLIGACKERVLSLPDIEIGQKVGDLNVLDQEKYLIGWWCGGGDTRPRQTLSQWMRRTGTWTTGRGPIAWGEKIRERIANQVEHIRHWSVIRGSYDTISSDIEATWFIDPPYQGAGKHYRCGSTDIDYGRLAEWCLSLKGQIIVCENVGADWLPFEPYINIKASESKHGGKVSKEALFYLETI